MAGVDLIVFDIGASGGLDQFWRQWEPGLKTFCFDPLTTEVERLNANEKNPNVQYYAAWLTCDDYEEIFGRDAPTVGSNSSFELTSAVYATKILRQNYIQKYFNKEQSVVYTETRTTIDQFCLQHQVNDVDFIKIDTDGHDYFVIRGALETLTKRGVLGLQVECQFHGPDHDHSNTFANIDRVLRGTGFTMFDLDAWRYTRQSLPGRFYYDIPAQTIDGQVQWCETLYLRDPIVNTTFPFGSTPPLRDVKMLKLLALYDAFGLPDCSAQLLLELRKKSAVPEGVNVSTWLDRLVPSNRFGLTTYNDYIAYFDADPTRFYPSNNKHEQQHGRRSTRGGIMQKAWSRLRGLRSTQR